MYKKEIGKNIKKFRLEAGYSQSDLGKLLNTTKQNISSWEKDRTQPDNDTIQKMADILGCKFNDIMNDNELIIDYVNKATPQEKEWLLQSYQNKEIEFLVQNYIVASDDIKNAVCKLLDIDRPEFLNQLKALGLF